MKKKTKNYVIIFALVVALLSVGYAVFAQAITGILPPAQWNVGFVDAKRTAITGDAVEVSPVTYNLTRGWFNVELHGPGDSVSYTFTVKNMGTINAKVKSIYVFDSNRRTNSILFDVNGLKVGDVLKPGKTAKLNVKASYNPNYTGDTLTSKELYVIVNYVQK